MKSDVTVILNGFRRPHRLKEQYDAVVNQSVKPTNIFYWQNTVNGVEYDNQTSQQCVSAYANTNFGVWSRFAYALNARTNWVCITDDDTIPGSNWLKNCLETHEKTPGLLGTIGVIFPEGIYHNVHRVGWDNPNEVTTKVDIVGHQWFFHRDLLSVLWRELPPLDQVPFVGEDIRFSHMIQKYTSMATYVPPHPMNDFSQWGSLKGWAYGDDGLATASTSMEYMRNDLTRAMNNGFRLIKNETI